MYKPIAIILLAALIVSGCAAVDDKAEQNIINDEVNHTTNSPKPNEGAIPAEESVDPKQTASDVLNLIKLKDLPRLAAYVHPTAGVRFSPYGYVNTETDVVMQPSVLQDALENDDLLEWGSYQGSGLPITLSFSDYYDDFIYDYDYVNAAQIEYNNPVDLGNSIDNATEIYQDSFIAEYHFQGTKAHDFMDRSSLRIVFTQHNKVWVVVGIIHDEWTI